MEVLQGHRGAAHVGRCLHVDLGQVDEPRDQLLAELDLLYAREGHDAVPPLEHPLLERDLVGPDAVGAEGPPNDTSADRRDGDDDAQEVEPGAHQHVERHEGGERPQAGDLERNGEHVGP